MASDDDVRRIALSLPETEETPHFEKTSFRVAGKIFATLGAGDPLMVKLDSEDQANLVAGDPARIQPVPGYWGRKGATFVRHEQLGPEALEQLLRLAWAACAPRRLTKTA